MCRSILWLTRSRFWGIFWIDARSKTSITQGVKAIAKMCGHQDESLEGVMLELQNSSHSWLLILDNADNTELDLAQFLPAGKKGSILITTRLTESGKHQTVGIDHYERLNQKTAIDLLFKACNMENSSRGDYEDNARAVVELLGCHALAVIQAGAAVSQSLCGLGEYKTIFLNQRRTLLECCPEQARSEYGGVYATFEVSATYLEARDDQKFKDALELLNFYAFMHFSDFPEVAFEEAWKNSKDPQVVSSRVLSDGEEYIEYLAPWHVTHLPSFMQSNPHDIGLDKMRLRKARSLLSSFSLVTLDSVRGTTRMHPVSHFWSRDRLQEREDSTNARLNSLSLLLLSIKDPYAVDPSPLSLSKQLQPHIESVAYTLKEWDCPKGDFHFQQSVFRLSYVMYYLRHDSALFELLQMTPIQADESWIRSRNGQYIQLLHADYMRIFGNAHEAVTLLERINEIRVQTLAVEDPELLWSQHRLAMAYLETKDTTEAIKLLERIVQTRHGTLAPEDETLLDSQHALASAYLDMGETDRAVVLLEEVVNLRARTLNPEHSNRLSSQHELARAYLEIGETEKAIALLEEVVEIRTRTLRPEHLDRLMSQHELASAYLEIEESDKAITLLEEVVNIKARTLRPEHQERLKSQHELARAYLEVEDTEKAIALLEEVVEIKTRTLKPEHSERLMSQFTLARAYRERGDTAKAINLLESVVEIRTKTLRGDHPSRVRSIYVLAQCHYRERKYERALELARSIEKVTRNRGRERIAECNAKLISDILEDMDRERTT